MGQNEHAAEAKQRTAVWSTCCNGHSNPKPDRTAANEPLIRPFLGQLALKIPVDLRYAVFKLCDGQSFAHIVSVVTGEGTNPLSQLASKRHEVDGRPRSGAGS